MYFTMEEEDLKEIKQKTDGKLSWRSVCDCVQMLRKHVRSLNMLPGLR